MTTVSPGKLVLLQDLIQDPQRYDNTSIRITGRLVNFQPANNIAIIEYKQSSLQLDTELIDIGMNTGTMVQCIGEVKYDQQLGQLVLKPRIIRDVDSLDMNLFEKTVLLRQQHEQTTYPSS
ncbi:telomere-capping, CST complex subunit-domain-containing protein [Halteromyces radiatus]|uniref:telomere-capping, CST complex subunit-domain-containing protein n=1 Tax=Halteromyces radiatus TaxID=101107 RepID=UPI00221F6285|nr:telomere-capping, CST complex subunit-domain-containing protein [Halteromyces radiatus]KAI8093329.1 telomere-capping, CST complex subunit-domain-containing protein [Halteromyces radiatus]